VLLDRHCETRFPSRCSACIHIYLGSDGPRGLKTRSWARAGRKGRAGGGAAGLRPPSRGWYKHTRVRTYPYSKRSYQSFHTQQRFKIELYLQNELIGYSLYCVRRVGELSDNYIITGSNLTYHSQSWTGSNTRSFDSAKPRPAANCRSPPCRSSSVVASGR
jgi:hypothetical protein